MGEYAGSVSSLYFSTVEVPMVENAGENKAMRYCQLTAGPFKPDTSKHLRFSRVNWNSQEQHLTLEKRHGAIKFG